MDNLVIDECGIKDAYNHKNFLHLGVPSDNSNHEYPGTEAFWRMLLKRLAVDDEWIKIGRYGKNNVCVIANTKDWVLRHLGC